MALNKTVKVAVPERGIAYKKVSGKTYVYYATATYRNAKGQPTCDRTSIGRLDEESGMLIPNRNYYEVYLKQPQPIEGGIYSYGAYHVFNEIIKKLGIDKQLGRYFPEKKDGILTIAQYMLSEGNVMHYLDDYTQTHDTALHGGMSDVQSSKLFSSLREEDIMLFLREWMGRRSKDEYIAYDVTSLSSYSKQIMELEWGYNRDKEKLPQINMGMYYGESSGLPLYYRIYPGSISDKTHLKYMVEDNEYLRGKKIRFVMDRGFYSAENLRYLAENGYVFIIALPGHLKYCQELIAKHRGEIVNISKKKLGKDLPYGDSYEVTELGFRMRVHLYYDAEKALQESEALYELIDRQENDLSQMKEAPGAGLHYDKYFIIDRSSEGSFRYIRNHEAIDKALSACGFFLIAETDFKKDSKEILHIYRNRDVVEKSFDDLKNELDFKRVRCHSSQSTNGKIFVSFISLIVRSYMLNKLSALPDVTLKRVFLELEKIRTLDFHIKAKPRLLNPVSKSARDIIQTLDLSIV